VKRGEIVIVATRRAYTSKQKGSQFPTGVIEPRQLRVRTSAS
jgi:hypothetical protein